MRALAVAASLAVLLAGCAEVPAPDAGGKDPAATAGSQSGSTSGGGNAGAEGGAGVGGSAGGATGGSMGGPSGSMGPGPGPGPGSSGTSGPTGSGSGSASTSTGQSWSVPQSLHQSTWLCQTAIKVDDARPGGTDDLECKVTLTFSSTQVTVASSGIPNHDYDSGGGCCAKVQTMSNTFPLQPQLATTPTYSSTRGAIAIAVNGVAIFGPEDSNDQDVVIWTDTSDQEPQLAMCGAHAEPNQGTYHYHSDANCIHWHAPSGQDWDDYSFDKVDATVHSKIIGFAKDGFPIYGSYGYAADNVTVKEITSSFRLKAGKTGSGGIDDQEYVAGLGDLDECNGRISRTPEFPDGIYHYYSTRKNGAGSWGFPYFPLCYKGVVATSGGGAGSGGGTMSGSGSMTGTMSGPPPSGSQTMSGTGGPPPCPPPGKPPPPGGCPP